MDGQTERLARQINRTEEEERKNVRGIDFNYIK